MDESRVSIERATTATDPPAARWRIAIDTGGTFTDAIATSPTGDYRTVKIPSDGSLRLRVSGAAGDDALRIEPPPGCPRLPAWCRGRTIALPGGDERRLLVALDAGRWSIDRPLEHPLDGAVGRVETGRDAPIVAVHLLVDLPFDEPLPPLELRLATTRATNALLERRGARTAILLPEGLGDLLAIGDQSRPRLFARAIVPRRPLVERSVEVPERRLADGRVRTPLDADALRRVARTLRAEGIEAIAVAFPHALRDPTSERAATRALAEEGFATVAAAHELSASPRFLSRAETAVVHATLAPILDRYLADVGRGVPRSDVFVMTSSGGLRRGDAMLARDALLSGPAGGVAALAEIGRRLGRRRLLGLDVGGTSADVARWEEGVVLRDETIVGDARVAAPSIAIESVAAGGGSICGLRAGLLHVGPESAGARPGPACYGLGGPLTITDVLLLLGRIDPLRASVPLSVEAARSALERLRAEVDAAWGRRVDAEELLPALLALADERMAGAIEAVTLRDGVDPREATLVPFGGAGGLHACAIADRLGIRSILLPREAGVLSARGLLGASIERIATRAILEPLASCAAALPALMAELDAEALAGVRADAPSGPEPDVVERVVAMRLAGQDRPLEVPFADEAELAAAFVARFRRIFGYPPPARALEVESLRVVAAARSPAPAAPSAIEPPRPVSDGSPRRRDRAALRPGERLDGPLVVADRTSSAFVAEGWRGEVREGGDLELLRDAPLARGFRGGVGDLELFAARLEAIATAMGEQLRRTALSPNVKERLDYSCAILDAEGTLLSNAPHLPVHLGAMGLCVRATAAALPLAPGDVALVNHPAFGGSHLPDVTVVTGVFVGERRVGFVATRAHHAEIGGTRPGSFPPSARSLAEEGVVFAPMLVRSQGQSRLDRIEDALRNAPYPSRSVEENLADLEAAIAANELGARAFAETAAALGPDRVDELARALLRRTEDALRRALAALAPRVATAEERLDDGTPIRVRIDVGAERTTIDFAGSGGVHSGNLNAPLAVVRAAVLYALRLLVDEEVPLNEGLLAPIDLRVPPGLLDPPFEPDPRRCPPVAAGNTETSQRIVDAMLRAFGLVAGGQGTMNNLLFGNDRYAIYETIAGGAGATADAEGADAVHVHMTNTRITDLEVLERRAPVVVRRFAIRRGSGGAGARRGGDGVVREIEFLEPTQLSILSQHRVERPYGLDGGGPGDVGRQCILRADGRVEGLPGVAEADCAAGDAVRIETPGGGAYGAIIDR